MNPGSSVVSGYLVNHDGDIIFPVLGKLHVVGLTHNELASMIESKLISEGHITDPVVTVKLMNFKVCVLGDVVRPGQLVVAGERLTIFEAITNGFYEGERLYGLPWDGRTTNLANNILHYIRIACHD